jgi:hypothetical protein
MEKNKPVDGAFLTAASPGVVALFQVNEYFATHEEYISALVPELAKEYAKMWRMVSCSSCTVQTWQWEGIMPMQSKIKSYEG